MLKFETNYWAVILGGSSGFGLATAQKLSRHGMNILIVHRDRRGAMGRIESEFDKIRETGVAFEAINTNALTEDGQQKVLDILKEKMGDHGQVRLVLHSIALGNLKPIVASSPESEADIAVAKLSQKLGVDRTQLESAIDSLLDEGIDAVHNLKSVDYGQNVLEDEDMAQTIYNMGTSLLTWVQKIHSAKMFANDARVLGLTSEGNTMAWKGYAAVAAAKVALESISRAIAVEFAPYGVRSNILQPGVTPTPALKLIPGSRQMEAVAKLRNPYKRLTTPEDVADFIALMCTDEARWINGSLIRVDGGEQIASL